MRRQAGPALDLAAVLLFVGSGRAVHAHGVSIAGLASTAWPFVSGLAAGWLALVLWRRSGTSLGGGLALCISTVAIGMALRVLSGQGTAAAFVAVALGFLGATMLGWRVLAAGLRHLRPARRAP